MKTFEDERNGELTAITTYIVELRAVEVDVAIADLLGQGVPVAGVKRKCSSENGVEEAAQGPNVGFQRIFTVSVLNFGREEEFCAELSKQVVISVLAESKVANLHELRAGKVHDENVLRLQVTMGDVVSVHVAQAFTDLIEAELCFGLRQRGAGECFRVLQQVATLSVLLKI